MRRFLYLIEKEFKHIFRDKFMPKLIFVIPVVQLLILPWAANFDVKNINLKIADRDLSPLSTRLGQKLSASEYFTATFATDSYEDGFAGIEKGKTDIVLEIPKGFEKSLAAAGGAQVLMSVNAINGIKGGLGASYANGIIAEFSAEVSADSAPRPNPQKIEILSDFKFNPYLSSKAFMVPAILVFLISLIGGILAALNIVSEKELGTMEQMNVAPVSKTMFIASKLFPVWIIGMAILSAGIILAYAVYGLLPKGSFLLVYLFAAIYLTAFTAFGLVVSNISSSAQQAILVFIFFIMIFLLMSGIFTPLSSMPAWAQNMTLLNPMRYIVEAIRAIYLKGATFSDLLPQFLAICAFSIALNIYAVASFKRSSN